MPKGLPPLPKFSLTSLFERVMLGLCIVLVTMIITSIFYIPHHLGPDVSMYTEIGQKLLDGQRPYVDYEENNFPMIHVLYTLPAFLSRATALPPNLTLNACLVALLLLSLGMMWRVLKGSDVPWSVVVTVLFGMALVSWLMFNTFQWGQREHLFTLFYLPGLALRVMRRDGKSIGRGVALMVGLMAGIGLAIKPYFALTGLLVEGVGLLTSRRWYIRTPEVVGVLTVVALHGLYFALNPDVLQAFIVLIQRLSAGYKVYIAAEWDIPILAINMIIIAVPFALSVFRYRYRVVPSNLLLALGAMGLGSMIGFLLQQKGWTYHAIPLLTSSLLTGVLLATEGVLGRFYPSQQRGQNLARFSIILMSVGLVAGMLSFQTHKVSTLLGEPIPGSTLIESAIMTYTTPGDSVMFVDTLLSPSYPMLARLNLRNVSRYPMVTPFPVSFYQYTGLRYDDPAHVVPAYMQEYLDAFQNDIAAYSPKLVIIRSDRCGACSGDFSNLYDYLTARGVIATAVSPAYMLLTIVEGFHVYVRNDLVRGLR